MTPAAFDRVHAAACDAERDRVLDGDQLDDRRAGARRDDDDDERRRGSGARAWEPRDEVPPRE